MSKTNQLWQEKVDAILDKAAQREMPAHHAVSQLVAMGFDVQDAEDHVAAARGEM